MAPSFDILVTSAGVNYPTVDTGDPALWLLYTLLIAPWARAPWEHHLLSNICRLSIFSSQKSPSACARSLPPSPGWCISSNGQKSGKLHVFYGHIISVNLRRGTHLLADGNIDNVKAWTRTTKCGPGERGKGSFWEWRERETWTFWLFCVWISSTNVILW